MAEETTTDSKVKSISEARAARTNPSGEGGGTGQGAGSSGTTNSTPRKRRTAKKTNAKKRSEQFEEMLPIETFREYSDEALDLVPNLLSVSEASEKQKKAIGTCGRNVVCKRLDNAENFDEAMLTLCLVPLVLKWSVEFLKNLADAKKAAKVDAEKNEKPSHTNIGQVGRREI